MTKWPDGPAGRRRPWRPCAARRGSPPTELRVHGWTTRHQARPAPSAAAEITMKVASYLSPKTAVKASGIAGRGLYANAPIVRGEVVSVKGGHLIDRETLERQKAVVKDADMQITDDLFL